jgi:hypothetical protein
MLITIEERMINGGSFEVRPAGTLTVAGVMVR